MSHEFRTPLGSIRSIARILQDRLDGPLTAEQEKQVKFIQDSAAELTDMVRILFQVRLHLSRELATVVANVISRLSDAVGGVLGELLGLLSRVLRHVADNVGHARRVVAEVIRIVSG